MSDSYSILLIGFESAGAHDCLAAFYRRRSQGHFRASRLGCGFDLEGSAVEPDLPSAAVRQVRNRGVPPDCRRRPEVPVVLVCSQPSVELLHEAWHAGAADVIFLPLRDQPLESSLKRAAKEVPVQSLAAGSIRGGAPALPGREREGAVGNNPASQVDDRAQLQQRPHLQLHEHIPLPGGDPVRRRALYRSATSGSKHGTYVNGVRIETAKLEERRPHPGGWPAGTDDHLPAGRPPADAARNLGLQVARWDSPSADSARSACCWPQSGRSVRSRCWTTSSPWLSIRPSS